MFRHHRSVSLVALSLVLAGSVGAQAAPGDAPQRAAAPTGQLTLIQGVPGVSASVSVDGRELGSGLDVGAVTPFDVAPGSHDVTFSAPDGMSAVVSVEVAAGQTNDVVFHLPASLGGEPVVSTYEASMGAIGPGKARVLVAHTATLAPADVVVDGQTVFNDIANGEFAEAEVPAGSRSVALIASSGNGDPVLGPLDVDLKASTVTRVYAVGRPDDGTMQIIKRSSKIGSDGTVVPDAIDTGSAGLAADVQVAAFGPSASTPAPQTGSAPWLWALVAGGMMLLVAAAGRGRRALRAGVRVARTPSPR